MTAFPVVEQRKDGDDLRACVARFLETGSFDAREWSPRVVRRFSEVLLAVEDAWTSRLADGTAKLDAAGLQAHYAETVRALRELAEREGAFVLPTALLLGRDAIAPLFPSRRVRKLREGLAGLERRVVVYREGSHVQLSLPWRGAPSLRASGGSPLEVVADVLGVRELRYFAGLWTLAARYERAGQGDGRRFLYTPSALLRVLGAPERSRGDFKAFYTRAVRESFETLQGTRIRTELRGPDGTLRVDEPLIAREGDVKVTLSAPQKGRPRPEVWSIAAPLVVAARHDGTVLPESAVATPHGVDPRRWDRAFALLLRLAAYARRNADRSAPELALRLPTLLEAGLTEAELRDALDLLRRHGFLSRSRLAGGRLVFALPEAGGR